MDSGTISASGTVSWMLEHSPAFAHMMQGIGDVSRWGLNRREKKQDEEKETSTEKQAESLENLKIIMSDEIKKKKRQEKVHSSRRSIEQQDQCP